MGDRSAIEWTDATWNPVTGCTKVTRGCDNCYAERLAERFRGTPGHPFENGFDLTLRPNRLSQPIAWKKPRRIFVNSMSDLFHKEIPREFIDHVFDTMEAADWHIFQILTKRSSLMKRYLQHRYGLRTAPPHIWCGVSVEDHAATARIRHLRETPVQVRFLSIEPLIGPVGDINLAGISWVIVGGESGSNARPMKQSWVLDIRDICQQNGVDFFFKQWGGLSPKSGGRQLEGIEHNAIPASSTPPLDQRRGKIMSRGKIMDFEWTSDGPPPLIKEHSKAKLKVLRSYLCAYFDKLNANPFREEFKLDLIDGFSGGGTFRDGNDVLPGSPLIMLEEADEASKRLNKNRNKPLRIDCKFHFIDINADHTNHLQKVLTERGHKTRGGRISIHNDRFENQIDNILKKIHRRQPRAGRAIFLLDQTGFSRVELALVTRILDELPTAEVILTFAADALVNHLAETPQTLKAVFPLQLTEPQIHDLIQLRNGDGGRALVQRMLRNHIRAVTGATFDTPFFIRPRKSQRALWFLHLSRHPAARDVMIQRHWDIRNTFEHYGTGGFKMLGWNSFRDAGTLPLPFNFEEHDERQMKKELLNTMPKQLHSLANEEPVTVDAIRHALANHTAAPFSILDQTILQLARDREINVLTPEGKIRSRALTRLHRTDMISFPILPLFPGFFRSKR